MDDSQLLNVEVVDILYKQLFGEELMEKEETLLKKWLNSSSYNRSVFNDINAQQKLKYDLMEAYSSDRSQFWNIVINYRTALHSGIPAPKGNFWKRSERWIQKILGIRRS